MKKISAESNSKKISIVFIIVFLSGFIFVYLNPQKPMSYINVVLGAIMYFFYNHYANKIATVETDDKNLWITLPKKETEQVKIKNVISISTNGVKVNNNYMYSIRYNDITGNENEVKFVSIDESEIAKLSALIEKQN